jgi:hypothetical protein
VNRADVLKVDELKEELSSAFRSFERSLKSVFGEMVYAVDTVVDRYNQLETKHDQLAADHQQLAVRLDAVSERLLALERARGEH